MSNPQRVYFSARGETKLDLAQYYLSVGDGIVNALRGRPCMLHRFPDGVDGEKVHQKRLPKGAPPWVETVRVHFPRYDRDADELCVTHVADVVWAVQMSTVEFHPWNSRRADVESPDEWRIDLDPMPLATFADVQQTAGIVRELLDELGAVGYPKTSGGKGLHVYVRIHPDHGFADVRRAAWAFAREVERRSDGGVDTTWWRKDRDPGSIFVDYNQNARDHTIASAYSVRGTPEGLVSAPITWDEVADVDPHDFSIATMPERYARIGDLHADIDAHPYAIDQLLEWADRDERDTDCAGPPSPSEQRRPTGRDPPVECARERHLRPLRRPRHPPDRRRRARHRGRPRPGRLARAPAGERGRDGVGVRRPGRRGRGAGRRGSRRRGSTSATATSTSPAPRRGPRWWARSRPRTASSTAS